jgi:hypothetical protein
LLWHFIYILYPGLVEPLHYYPSSLMYLLKMTLTSSMFRIHRCIFALLCSLHLPSLSHYYSPLNRTCFLFLPFIVFVSAHCSLGFYLDILPVNIFFIFLVLFLLPCYCSTVSVYFTMSCSYTDVMYFSTFHSLAFSSFPPPLVSFNSDSYFHLRVHY